MSNLLVSSLAPRRFSRMPKVPGVRMAAIKAGVKYSNRADLSLFELASGTSIAGVFSRSSMPGAPVTWCKDKIAHGKARAIIINAGNANVFTGRKGLQDVKATAMAVANQIGCRSSAVFVASTGVIGEPLNIDNLLRGIPRLYNCLKETSWKKVARAIGTTDTFPKFKSVTTEIDGIPLTIAGIAKGSGMIAPDMATMLSFIFTDAKLPVNVLQGALDRNNRKTFNCITVDSDTSTSDMVLLAATGKGLKHAPIEDLGDKRLAPFLTSLELVMRDLALQIVRDGEGASKIIQIKITGASSRSAARRIGMSIANSPLVKTAIAGEDANWGRIVMAIGKSGATANRDRLVIRIGDVLVAKNGEVHKDYDETDIMPHMRGEEIFIGVDVGVGKSTSTVWTCDLTHDYISINADYRS